MNTVREKQIGFFDKYLSVWVILCIAVGVLIGKYIPVIPDFLKRLEYKQVSLPIAVLIWLMIYPMMLKIDFGTILNVRKKPKGLILTLIVNWLIQPFSMMFFAVLFLKYIFSSFIPGPLANEYIAGAILLGAAPCTAMVFVWSYLADGSAEYTLVQVAVNDLIVIVLYAPIVMLLLGVTNLKVPYATVFLSVVLFVVIPLVFGYITRKNLIKRRGKEWFEKKFLHIFKDVTVVGLLLTLIIIFSYQGEKILSNYIHILLIAVPLTIQTFFIFGIVFVAAHILKLPYKIAGPAAFIGSSNFFELAVAVAISLFGLSSGATLATVVGVLVEVPVMLTIVWIVRHYRIAWERDIG